MTQLTDLTVRQLQQGLASKTFSSLDVTNAYLDRIETLNPAFNAFITVCDEQARKQAVAADQARAAGDAGPLTGIPMAHKDLFCTEGTLTSCGSKMLANFIAPYDAHVVSQCHHAKLVCLGKLNMDEFAMGSSNENSHYGPVKNPWDVSRVPGGSSGGSAAAVAARLVPIATATDTGGSIRQPAAFTNTSGIKPTYGRVSRYGMVAYASSLDQGGLIANTAEDLALGLSVIAGFDPRDATSANRPVDDYASMLSESLDGLTLGLPDVFFDHRLGAAMRARLDEVIAVFQRLGATCVAVQLPHVPEAIAAYYVIASAEASANLSRFDGVRYGHRCQAPQSLEELYEVSRAEGFGEEVKRRILVGTYALSEGYFDAYYKKAQQIRRLIHADFTAAFQQCDLILGPTTPSTAFPIGEKSNDPVAMYLEDIYTVATNLAGLPGGSFPAGFIDGLPAGYQLTAPPFAEHRILRAAHQLQQHTDWHSIRPKEHTHV